MTRKIILAIIFLIASSSCNSFNRSTDKDDKSLQAEIKKLYLFNPPPNAVLSDDPLPLKVNEARAGRVLIAGGFYRIGRPDLLLDVGAGTGFRISEDIILSAKHILFSTIIRRNLPFVTDQNGIPQGINYTYSFIGIEHTPAGPREIPLSLIAMGELGQFQDFMAFKIMGNTGAKILKLQNSVKEREEIYASGFVPKESPMIGLNGRIEPVLSDVLDYTFKGWISAKINDLPANRKGLAEYYRAKISAEHGFSGGPVFNKNGEVIGMTIEGTLQFTYILSAKDLINFVEKMKQKGLTK